MIPELLAIALAAVISLYSGSTFTSVLGTQETKNNLILNVRTEGNVKKVSLDGYSVLQYENVSISGSVIVDEHGNITEYRDVKITGVPAKLKTVSGILSEDHADITLKGKAAGVFNFEVHYTAELCR